jgi:hypothetical protein
MAALLSQPWVILACFCARERVCLLATGSAEDRARTG